MSDFELRVGAGLVAIAGVAIAGYLTWAHYSDAAVVCVAGGGCDSVLSSSYAEIAGVPVAAMGLGAYGTILVLVVWDAPVVRLAAAAIALVGVLFTVYLLVVQLFVLDAFCIWCLANDVLVAPAVAVLTALRLRA